MTCSPAQGLVLYFSGEFQDALERFKMALELSDLVARDKGDPTARKNAACCLNNIGVCNQMLGNRWGTVVHA